MPMSRSSQPRVCVIGSTEATVLLSFSYFLVVCKYSSHRERRIFKICCLLHLHILWLDCFAYTSLYWKFPIFLQCPLHLSCLYDLHRYPRSVSCKKGWESISRRAGGLAQWVKAFAVHSDRQSLSSRWKARTAL